MAHFTRSAVLTSYVDVARSVGLDPFSMLRLVGLPFSCLSDPETRISTDAVNRLLEASAAAAGVEDFGLRLAETRELSLLGPVGLVVREQPTIGKALEALMHYFRLHNDAVALHIEEAGDVIILRSDVLLEKPFSTRQAVELSIGAVVRILRALLGKEWRPLSACFAHGPPAQLDSHRRLFGPCVEFGHEFTGLILDRSDLEKLVPNADPRMAIHLTRYVDQLVLDLGPSTEDSIRAVLVELLAKGPCTAELLARRLGLNRRTVHNHLALSGSSFSALLMETRRQLAIDHLENSARSLASIADMLGFSAPSAFTRWFRAAFGCTPRDWRRSSSLAHGRPGQDSGRRAAGWAA